MIELGRLSVKTPEAFSEARRKILSLAEALGYAQIRASRMASVFSELLRLGSGSNAGVSVTIGMENSRGKNGLSLMLSYGDRVIPESGAGRSFDHFKVSSPEGAPTTISAFSYFPDPFSTPSLELMEPLRQMLAMPSRAELFKNLQEKNRELEESAVEIRKARDRAEEASIALQHQVNELAAARHAMLNILQDLDEAKTELEATHRQILDSIRYASRIQRAVLPSEKTIRETFSQCMILWEPRDVVGGDLYWCRAWGEGDLLILGDCTGHGVPGAFMTLIANGALDQAMQKANPGDPGDLIGHMHRLMQTWLGQDGAEGESDDGIELGACYLPPGRKEVIFAGARFGLFCFDGGNGVEEIHGDKKGIGYRAIPHEATFTNRVVEALPGRRFFMTSDGIIDQVGGEKHRGFGKKRFGKLIARLADVPLQDHGRYFMEELTSYQGREKRRDDVSVVGFSLDRG